ncbi:MAG: hypothetical protein SVR08_16265, partial [Spirochaetota bacterium]|nr:hypothetical protein [Spirochaetota bacterium]
NADYNASVNIARSTNFVNPKKSVDDRKRRKAVRSTEKLPEKVSLIAQREGEKCKTAKAKAL